MRPPGLLEYLIVHGKATIEEGGAAELLQELAHVYLGPEVRFPPMDDPPPGVRLVLFAAVSAFASHQGPNTNAAAPA